MPRISFEVVAECPHPRARAGLLHTPPIGSGAIYDNVSGIGWSSHVPQERRCSKAILSTPFQKKLPAANRSLNTRADYFCGGADFPRLHCLWIWRRVPADGESEYPHPGREWQPPKTGLPRGCSTSRAARAHFWPSCRCGWRSAPKSNGGTDSRTQRGYSLGYLPSRLIGTARLSSQQTMESTRFTLMACGCVLMPSR